MKAMAIGPGAGMAQRGSDWVSVTEEEIHRGREVYSTVELDNHPWQ